MPLTAADLISREFKALFRFHLNYKENIKLRDELGRLKNEASLKNEAALENERLKRLLDLKLGIKPKMLAARVISKDASNYSYSVVIDRGLDRRLKRGMVVLNSQGLVGRIAEVYKKSSRVLLITDPRLSVSTIVQRTRMQAVVSGNLRGMLIMRYVGKGSDLQEGDAVITSGMTQNYPKGIAVGNIIEAGSEFGGLSIYAVIRPAVEFSRLEEVLVMVE